MRACLLAGGVTLAMSFAVQAQDFSFDIRAGDLKAALESYVKQTGRQLIYQSADVKGRHTGGVHGAMSAEQALAALLAGTGLQVNRDASGAIAIFPAEVATGGASTTTAGVAAAPSTILSDRSAGAPVIQVAPAEQTQTFDEIIVTARKKSESIIGIPISITAFSADSLKELNIKSFTDYATKVPSLSFAYGNGTTGIAQGRTVAIRGITGPGTTGFYIDDTPVPASIDPRALDIERIEILKGPQGTLYGESSLGGNVKLVTHKPDTSATRFGFLAEAGGTDHGGSANYTGEAVGNWVLVPDKVGVRMIGFVNHDAGYITRTFPDPADPAHVQRRGDQGAGTTYGATASILDHLTDHLDASLRLMVQRTSYHGFPATYAPLPNFVPDYTQARVADIQTSARDRWWTTSVELAYRGEGWALTSATSYFNRSTHDLEDGTEGTNIIFSFFGVALPYKPYPWVGDNTQKQVAHETRISFDPIKGVSGTAGVFFKDDREEAINPDNLNDDLVTLGYWPTNLVWALKYPRHDRDASLFGELYYDFLDHFSLTAGVRQYWLRQSSSVFTDGFLNQGTFQSPTKTASQSGVSPKFALAYKPSASESVYVSAAKGFRAGGSNPAIIDACGPSLASLGLTVQQASSYKSDTVWNYEVGFKAHLARPNVTISAAGFRLDWDNIQQNLYLPSCGFLLRANAGAARVKGGELEIAGEIIPELQLRLGLGYNDARITSAGASGQAVGSRVLQTPAWTATIGGVYEFPVSERWRGFLQADYSYVGDSLSANSGAGVNFRRPSYSLTNARIGVRGGASELSVNVKNLTNSKPNLGDLAYNGYPNYDANGNVLPMVATLQPLSVSLQYRWNF